MAGRVRFVCLLHSHQPVGNFDHVIEEAYRMSYLPYADAFARHPRIPLTNHFSGCLLEWLEEKHPEYFARLREAGSGERAWETMGGGFYEPILTMLPRRDRLGQIGMMAEYVEKHFGTRPRGMWLAERVWEPALVSDLADAGAKYLTLDDSHFRAAGLGDEDLVGAYVTEDQGRTMQVYPASERLRYLIPYAKVDEVVGYLRSLVPAHGERVVCYADDGEKFGVWPNTFKHVYEDGWLENLLAALDRAQDEGWLVCSTLSDAYDEVAPVGRVYLPENSYREMTEWALPAPTLAAYERAAHDVKDDPRLSPILPLVKGGNWRSFRVKYAEGGRLYAKMMEVSEKVDGLNQKQKLAALAQRHLFRGQCNCPYWHGVFGGMYLPHLRSAIYRQLIEAEKLADESKYGFDACVAQDFDFDGAEEVKLANPHLALYFHPGRGGHLYEFDLRTIAFNVGDTFSRRYEAYHDKVARAVVGDGAGASSIHEMVKAKEAGLEALLQYDGYLRESLVDHLSPRALTTGDLLSGRPPSDPGFRQGVYEPHLEGGGGKAKKGTKAAGGSVRLTRTGYFHGRNVTVSKTIAFTGKDAFEVAYEISHDGRDALESFFAVEMNYALLAGEAHDRYYYHDGSDNAGKLATVADLGERTCVGLKDHWLGVALSLRPEPPAQALVSPVKTVSQSEGGFESVYQCSSVLMQWPLKLAPGGTQRLTLTQETGRA